MQQQLFVSTSYQTSNYNKRKYWAEKKRKRKTWSETVRLLMEIKTNAFYKAIFTAVCFQSCFQRWKKTISGRKGKDNESRYSKIS